MGRARHAKRKTRQIYCRLDRVMGDLLELADVFRELHPTYATYLELIAKAALQVQGMVVKFYDKSWGRVPSNWYMNGQRKGD